MPSAGKEREVGSVKTVIIPKTEVCTMGAPPGMNAATHSSMADPLIWGASSEHPHSKEHQL